MRTLFFLLILSFSVKLLGQHTYSELLLKGNEEYQQQRFAKAQECYVEALKLQPENTTAKFNLAAARCKLNKKEDAEKLYTEIIEAAPGKGLLAKAWYNKGVIFSQQKKLEESIEAYKNALRQNPIDKETRENLQKALLELKKKSQSKKQDNKDQKKQEQPKPNQSKLKPKEADQRLKLLQQKEKEIQERVQQKKIKGSPTGSKDW